MTPTQIPASSTTGARFTFAASSVRAARATESPGRTVTTPVLMTSATVRAPLFSHAERRPSRTSRSAAARLRRRPPYPVLGMRSASVTTPMTRPRSSVTGSPLTSYATIAATASLNGVRGSTATTSVLMTSETFTTHLLVPYLTVPRRARHEQGLGPRPRGTGGPVAAYGSRVTLRETNRGGRHGQVRRRGRRLDRLGPGAGVGGPRGARPRRDGRGRARVAQRLPLLLRV